MNQYGDAFLKSNIIERDIAIRHEQGFQFRPANGEFRQTFSFNPTQIPQELLRLVMSLLCVLAQICKFYR
jgi:cytochrome oxidase Cu insertion factor (SCO1/SenC/PrrC family)